MPDSAGRYDPPPERSGDVHVYQTSPGGGGAGPGLVIGIVLVIVLIAGLWFVLGRGGGTVVPERMEIDVNLPEAPAPSQPSSPPPATPNPGGGS